jgi:hypothetical protein
MLKRKLRMKAVLYFSSKPGVLSTPGRKLG